MNNLERYEKILSYFYKDFVEYEDYYIDTQGNIEKCPMLVKDCNDCIFYIQDECLKNIDFINWLRKDAYVLTLKEKVFCEIGNPEDKIARLHDGTVYYIKESGLSFNITRLGLKFKNSIPEDNEKTISELLKLKVIDKEE